jgi:hypothetical protein
MRREPEVFCTSTMSKVVSEAGRSKTTTGVFPKKLRVSRDCRRLGRDDHQSLDVALQHLFRFAIFGIGVFVGCGDDDRVPLLLGHRGDGVGAVGKERRRRDRE